MGRKTNFAEREKKGPGKKAKKQQAPKFSKKILPKSEKLQKLFFNAPFQKYFKF
jgi:hypothetical protein